VSAVVRPI